MYVIVGLDLSRTAGHVTVQRQKEAKGGLESHQNLDPLLAKKANSAEECLLS